MAIRNKKSVPSKQSEAIESTLPYIRKKVQLEGNNTNTTGYAKSISSIEAGDSKYG